MKDRKSSKHKDLGYYPTKDRDELYFDVNQPFIPYSPVIVYNGMSSLGLDESIEISLQYNGKTVETSAINLKFHGNTSENVDYFSFKSIITELNLTIQSNFAITKYLLE